MVDGRYSNRVMRKAQKVLLTRPRSPQLSEGHLRQIRPRGGEDDASRANFHCDSHSTPVLLVIQPARHSMSFSSLLKMRRPCQPAVWARVDQRDLDGAHTFFLPPARAASFEYGWEMKMVGNQGYVTAVKPGSDAEAKGLKP